MVAAWAPRPCANAGWTSPAIKTTIIVNAFRIGASCYHQDQDTLFLCAVRLRGMLTRCCCHLPVLGQIRETSVEQAAILICCLQRLASHPWPRQPLDHESVLPARNGSAKIPDCLPPARFVIR